MITIRFASIADIPTLIEMGKVVHAEARQSSFPYDPEKLASQLKAVLDPPNQTHCIFLAEHAKEGVIGAFIGYVAEYFFSRALTASNIVFYVKREYRGGPTAVRLLFAFRKWAENRNASELSISITSGARASRLDKLMEAGGYQYTGVNYSLLLNRGDANK
jgi:hypothetical protein